MAIAVAMVTPVSLALVFNVTCLTKSIYAIRHVQQVGDESLMVFVISVSKWGLMQTRQNEVNGFLSLWRL